MAGTTRFMNVEPLCVPSAVESAVPSLEKKSTRTVCSEFDRFAIAIRVAHPPPITNCGSNSEPAPPTPGASSGNGWAVAFNTPLVLIDPAVLEPETELVFNAERSITGKVENDEPRNSSAVTATGMSDLNASTPSNCVEDDVGIVSISFTNLETCCR